MPTNNAINLSASGIAVYNSSTGVFSADTTTIHDVLVGAASNGITNVAPSATSGIALVSTGASSDPAFGTTVVAGGGTGATAFNINGVVISNTTSTGALAALTLADGEIVIGATGAAPLAATITAGSGISVVNGTNSITIASTATGFVWNDVTSGTQTIAVQNGYVADNAVTVAFTLPATAVFGDTFSIVGNLGSWSVAQAAGQQIRFGNTATTVGITGSLASTNAGDCIEAVCVVGGASSIWRVKDSQGNIAIV